MTSSIALTAALPHALDAAPGRGDELELDFPDDFAGAGPDVELCPVMASRLER